MYFILKKPLLQPIIPQTIINVAEPLLANNIISLTPFPPNNSLHQTKWAPLTKMWTFSPKVGWKRKQYGDGVKDYYALRILQNYCTQNFSKMWTMISPRRDQGFPNLLIRDETVNYIFYISCLETGSRTCFIRSQISRRDEILNIISCKSGGTSRWQFSQYFEIETPR